MSNSKTNSYKTITMADIKAATQTVKSISKEEKKAREAKLKSKNPKTLETPQVKQILSSSAHLSSQPRDGAAWNTILAIARRRENIDALISPASKWTWDQRFAVRVRRPGIPVGSPSKSDILGVLHRLKPVQIKLLEAGYKQEYAYNPSFTDPDCDVWLGFCRDVLQESFYQETLKNMSRLTFTPPTLASMIRKTAQYLGPDLPEVDPEIFKLLREHYRYAIPAAAFVFPKRTKPAATDRPGFEKEVVDNVNAWLQTPDIPEADGTFARVDRPFVLKATSAGFPYCVTKAPSGASWNNCHSPAFLEDFLTSKTSVTRRFLTRTLDLALRKRAEAWSGDWAEDTVDSTPMQAARVFMDAGARWYDKIYAQNRASRDTGGSADDDFWPHFVKTVMAGNIKPVTLAEIEEGKPDRSVYNSPALLRYLSAKINMLAYDHIKCDWYHRPGWLKGNAQTYVHEIMTALGEREYQLMPHGKLEHLSLIGTPNTVDLKPDVKAMDMHTQPEFIREHYRHDIATPLVASGFGKADIEKAMLFVLIGFISRAGELPMCLSNAGVMYFPTHLNDSGAAHTYLVNEKRSGITWLALKDLLPGQKHKIATEFPGSQTFVRAVGDDCHIVIKLPSRFTGAGDLHVNTRDATGEPTPEAKQYFREFRTFWRGAGEKLGGLAAEINKAAGWTFKAETLEPARDLSTNPFLGHHLYWSKEFVSEDRPLGVVLAARPLESILFSASWPKTLLSKFQTNQGLTPNAFTAIRCYAAFLEAAPAYPGVRTALTNLFEEKKRVAGQVTWDSAGIRSLADDELANPALFGFDRAPSDVLEAEVRDFTLGSMPSIEDVWLLHTGQALPQRVTIESSEESGEEPDLTDLDADLAPARRRKPSDASAVSTSSIKKEDPDVGGEPDVSDL